MGAGVSLQGGDHLDLVSSSLIVSANMATAQVHNRNILGASGMVTAILGGLCARPE
jgi:hypothetical protein